jgi:hypothetical protein
MSALRSLALSSNALSASLQAHDQLTKVSTLRKFNRKEGYAVQLGSIAKRKKINLAGYKNYLKEQRGGQIVRILDASQIPKNKFKIKFLDNTGKLKEESTQGDDLVPISHFDLPYY